MHNSQQRCVRFVLCFNTRPLDGSAVYVWSCFYSDFMQKVVCTIYYDFFKIYLNTLHCIVHHDTYRISRFLPIRSPTSHIHLSHQSYHLTQLHPPAHLYCITQLNPAYFVLLIWIWNHHPSYCMEYWAWHGGRYLDRTLVCNRQA